MTQVSPRHGLRAVLRRRLPALFCTLLLLVAAGGAYIGMSRHAEAQLARDAQLRLSLVADTLNAAIKRIAGIPPLVGATGMVQSLLQHPGDENIRNATNDLLARTARANDLDDLFILDAQGVTQASSNFGETGSFVGKDYSFRPYFQIARKNEQPVVSYYGVGVTTGRPGYFLASRIAFGPGPEDFGVAVAKTEFSRLESSWAEGGEHVLVSDADDVVFLSADPQFRYRPLKHLSHATLDTLNVEQRYARHAPGVVIDLLRDLPEGAIATREVPGTAWQITAVLPRDDRQWQPLAAALAVLLAGLLATLAAMTISQQRARRTADQRIKQDLERRVEERAAELVEAMSRLEAEMVERRQSEAELSKARDELIQAGKLASMGQAFAGLAHEINQPLAALKTYLSSTKLLIARGDTDSAAANLGIMDETVERLVQLSGDLKHLSRRSDNRLVEVDLAATARRVIGLMRFRIRDAGASVRETLDDDVQVVADQAHIEQIILNLLKNAVDVAADATCKDIMVQASLQNGMACLSVGDCGPGVPESARGRLFEPFFTTKGVGKGLGLGLAISYAIARDHGGVLRYERTPAGQTWFHLVLPARPATGQQEQHA